MTDDMIELQPGCERNQPSLFRLGLDPVGADIGSAHGDGRQAANQVPHVWFRKARREQLLDPLVALAGAHREPLANASLQYANNEA
jgi:hypothetical protein